MLHDLGEMDNITFFSEDAHYIVINGLESSMVMVSGRIHYLSFG